jgi:hypothetical protein
MHSRDDQVVPPWLRSAGTIAWKHRSVVGPVAAAVAALAAVAGGLVYALAPSDLQRAEADLKRGDEVIASINAEAAQRLEEAEFHRKRAKHFEAVLAEKPDTTDREWVEWNRSKLSGHKQLYEAKLARRDTLIHLAAHYQRLLAEAECEFLRAKDARDRGTPYRVAPRVRELLTPVLADR